MIRMKTWTNKAQVVNSIHQDTIPFEIIGNWAVANLIVAGEKRRYIIDTGGSMVLDYSDVFNDRIVTKSKLYKNIYFENKQRYFASTSKIDTVVVGKNKYSEVGAMIADFKLFSDLMTCEDIKGIIGINIMKKGVWSFDYSTNQVIVSPNIENFDLENSHVFDLIDVKGFENPIIRLNVEGKSLVTFIDTGNAGYSILYNEKITNKFEGQMIKTHHASNKLIGENLFVDKEVYSDSSSIMNLKTSDFGDDFIFTAMNANITSSKANERIDMLLGYDFLKNFITTFDWGNKKVYFQSIPKREIEIQLTSKNMSIDFHIYDKKLYVVKYLDGYFSKGEINIGDTVKAINHITIEEIVNQDNFCEFVRGQLDLYLKQDTTIITVKNKLGETRDLKMFDVKLFD